MNTNNEDVSFYLHFKKDNTKLKKIIRKNFYPLLNLITTKWLSKKFKTNSFKPNFWLWGQRGNDYQRLRDRVNRYKNISGCDIFVAGCGSGKDLPSWLAYKPKKVVGVDLFDHSQPWAEVILWANKVSPDTSVQLFQGNLEHLNMIEDNSFDIVASDAVFEHLTNLPKVLAELKRILRPGGIIYATFGPMWHTWGGDHYSGFDILDNGYNHLLLQDFEYKKYLKYEQISAHSENDGRTWIKEGLFSYLRPQEYVDLLEATGFNRLIFGVIVEPRALQYAKKNSHYWHKLRERYDVLDLILTGMTVIYQKKL